MKRYTVYAFVLLTCTPTLPAYVNNHNMTYFTDRYEDEKIEEARIILTQHLEEHQKRMKLEEDAQRKLLERYQNQRSEEDKNVLHAKGYLDDKMLKHVLANAPENIKEYLNRLDLLKKSGDEKNYNECILPAMLLEGLPGVGKSDLAKAIGQKLGRPVLVIETSHLGNQFKDSVAENLRKSIEDALKKNNNLVIILEELDSIIDARKAHVRIDTDPAIALWRILDHYKKNKNVLFIATTNNSSNFNEAIKSRFAGARFHVDKPNEESRKQAFKYLIDKKNGSIILDEASIQQLAYNSKGYTYREIEDLVQKMYYHALDNGKAKLEFDEIKNMMKIYRFYHALYPDLRGCSYEWKDKTNIERVLCTANYWLPVLITVFK